MFRSEGDFRSLDDLFHVDEPGHSWSREEIERRKKELEAIYKEWKYDLWQFSDVKEDRDMYQDYTYTAVNTLREASLCHIMGFFSASVLLSSVAVERLLHCILLISKSVKQERVPKGAQLVKVRTVTGEESFAQIPGLGLEPIINEDNEAFFVRLPTLGKESLEKALELGYPPQVLLDSNESFDNCAFVSRRHAIAHARFERLDLIEQSHSFVTSPVPNPYPAFDQQMSLDQYRKASRFISLTFERFAAVYGSSLRRTTQ